MIMLSQQYEESLYPLQDGVMSILSKCNTHFYLTGGTALSRGYYNHRYSDDLDFFVNNDPDYNAQVDEVLSNLKLSGLTWDSELDYIRSEHFVRVKAKAEKSAVSLKLDFVNDTAPHFGEIINTKVYNRTDSIRNILSNKITALFRFEAKDVADIREIALHEHFDWTQAIRDARQKEAGVRPAHRIHIVSTACL